jgi:hypothetical protein
MCLRTMRVSLELISYPFGPLSTSALAVTDSLRPGRRPDEVDPEAQQTSAVFEHFIYH